MINGRNETYGFPSKIEDDPVLSLVVKEDKSMQYAEERRLFYVAMTRTKNRVYFIAPEKNPSEFLLEIKKEYGNVFLRGKWEEEECAVMGRYTCPVCGFPLQLKYKPAYGLRLYICTNEPEICSFMTSNLRGKKLSIMKCPDCYDGYLIVKNPKKGGECFLGCSNYKENRQGCNKTVSMREYNKMMGYDPSEIDDAGYRKNSYQKQKGAPEHQNMVPRDMELRNGMRNMPIQDLKRQDMAHQSIKQQHMDHWQGNRQVAEEAEVRHKNWERELMEETKEKELDDSKYPVYDGHSVLEIAGTALQCLVSISADKFYKDTILIRTLCGSSDKRILQDKLNLVPEYGRLSYLSRGLVRKVVNWLIDKRYILETKGAYPVLHITNEGLHYKDHMTPRNMKSLFDLLNGTSEGEENTEEENSGER